MAEKSTLSVKNVFPVQAPSPGGLLQRACACGNHSAGNGGECEECKKRDGMLQRATGNTSSINQVPTIVHEVLRSPGQSLDAQTRAFMEPHFGRDFSSVLVHTNAKAAESARAVDALAYAVGRDLVFDAGQYAPQTSTGQRLLAHELTHVVQQNDSSMPAVEQLQLNPAGDRFEQEADRVADALVTRTKKDLPIIPTTASGLSPVRPCLQRTATFVQGTVSNDLNPAELIAENKIPDANLFLGETNFILNGTRLSGNTTARQARQALHTPGIASAKRTQSGGGVDCWFSSVPTNQGSYEMKLLKPGSWKHVTAKKNVAGRFPTLRACKNGFGDVMFIVKSDDALRKKIEIHEKQHAQDYEEIFNTVLVPWDQKVTDAHKKSQKMAGKDDNTCENYLYMAAVGQKQTPDDIVVALTNEINTRATAFHKSPAGAKPNLSIKYVDPDCNVVRTEF